MNTNPDINQLVKHLKTKKVLLLTTSNRWEGSKEIPKSSKLAEMIQAELGSNCDIIDVSKLNIHSCEGNVSTEKGNSCGLKDSVLKDKIKNPSGCHRCWASINNPDDELWKVSKPLLEADAIVFFGSIRWGSVNATYQKLIERLSWLENRWNTLGEDNILKGKLAGIVLTGHNWNCEVELEKQKQVFKFYGFDVPDEISFHWQWTTDANDESLEGYIEDPKDFKAEYNVVSATKTEESIQNKENTMKHVKIFEDFLNEKRPEWQDSDAPDANGRFKELGIKDLAAWLIKTRNKDLKKITGSLNQQIVFNRNDDPEYAAKMNKVRDEVYKQLGREDLLKENDGERDVLGELNEMTLGQLERIADYADMIKERMEAGEQLESWMYSQLTVALENMNAVHDAMDGNDGVEEGKKPGPDAYMTGLDDETEEKKKEQMKKQAEMDDDDDSAYKELPGDKEAREKGKVKTSKHTKSYHELYGDSVDEAEEKQSTDRSPIDDDAIETGLKTKSEETGVPIGILRAVMRRGLAAWKTGHRPGANQQQWGYARVNSFLTKQDGTWGGADKDLAKEVRDGGHDKKLK